MLFAGGFFVAEGQGEGDVEHDHFVAVGVAFVGLVVAGDVAGLHVAVVPSQHFAEYEAEKPVVVAVSQFEQVHGLGVGDLFAVEHLELISCLDGQLPVLVLSHDGAEVAQGSVAVGVGVALVEVVVEKGHDLQGKVVFPQLDLEGGGQGEFVKGFLVGGGEDEFAVVVCEFPAERVKFMPVEGADAQCEFGFLQVVVQFVLPTGIGLGSRVATAPQEVVGLDEGGVQVVPGGVLPADPFPEAEGGIGVEGIIELELEVVAPIPAGVPVFVDVLAVHTGLEAGVPFAAPEGDARPGFCQVLFDPLAAVGGGAVVVAGVAPSVFQPGGELEAAALLLVVGFANPGEAVGLLAGEAPG